LLFSLPSTIWRIISMISIPFRLIFLFFTCLDCFFTDSVEWEMRDNW
jgi:hypothetical protein